MIEKNIDMRLADGTITSATIIQGEDDANCLLRLKGAGIDEMATGTDYFASFAEIRKTLAKRNIFPLCYGASRNVWPSAMARDMGQGLAAYKMKMGIPADELVNIFDTGPDVDPVAPEIQESFYRQWIKSL